jgi:hypothetical protein
VPITHKSKIHGLKEYKEQTKDGNSLLCGELYINSTPIGRRGSKNNNKKINNK